MLHLHNDELFNILVGKISTAINRTFLRAFANEGIDITTEQWSVLTCLWRKDGVTQQDLCNLTLKDKPSMTRLIDKLERSNLVTRISSLSDRRINMIQLTEGGKSLEQKATNLVQSIAEKTLSNITTEELDTSRNVLKKIMINLQ
ncbi:MAG: MarR family transcriptional regulator [Paludibacter sp.]|nr:MarR family transcriptional regulator [Paludibacter sp.]